MAEGGLKRLGERAKAAAALMARADRATRDDALSKAAAALDERAGEILDQNVVDLDAARDGGASAAALDRLRLSEGRVEAMADGLRAIAALPDPVGEVVEERTLDNGVRLSKVRVPLGVIGVVYENRPNVTADSAGLCVKAGNAVMLRGSGSALGSNRAIVAALREGLGKAGLPEDGVLLVEDVAHETVEAFVRLRGVIDCLVPRGGPGLVELVVERATVPYVVDGDGNCHVYVDASADLDMAERIVVNAKIQRPSVCNAMETLLVHVAVAEEALSRFARALEGVELVGDRRARAIVTSICEATDEDYATEFLAPKLAIAVVDDLDGALSHIARYSTGHSEAIVTSDPEAARRFVEEVDSACVLVNASTRLVDGAQFGFGAEIGISTQKLHARGPMGSRDLTTTRYVLVGEGQLRA